MRASRTSSNQKHEVLFQKLGATWYVFSEVKNDLIYTAVPEGIDPYQTTFDLIEVIEDHMVKINRKSRKKIVESAL